MRKSYLTLFLLLTSFMVGRTQQLDRDSLETLLTKRGQDTVRVLLLSQIGYTYRFTKTDSCIWWTQQSLDLARTLKFTKGEVRALNTIGESLRSLGNFPEALEKELEALQISKRINYLEGQATSFVSMGFAYVDLGQYEKSLDYFHQGIRILEDVGTKRMISFTFSNLGNAYEKLNRLDSALSFQEMAYAIAKDDASLSLQSLVLTRLGIVHARLHNYDKALGYYKQALQTTYRSGDLANRSTSQYRIAQLFFTLNQRDSSFYYAQRALFGARGAARKTVLDASRLMAKLYKDRNQLDSALHYQEVAAVANDSLFGPEKYQQLQLLIVSEQGRQQKILQDQADYKNRIQLYSLLATVAGVLLIAIILYRNNRQKQKANTLLQLQKNEIQSTLTELKATQSQLIQSEKMASLGELTAGIAHEIQNPLNFVNNFSEVNKELLAEMKNEIDNGNLKEVQGIATNIIENEEKITFHGKRADAIVKGMLQHSRSSSGVKEPTDINALADEYLRLAYHGLRAKDKSFNATMTTDFDEALTADDAGVGKIDVIPQDIGRAILNLITNAFYAVTEKKKQMDDHRVAGQPPYEPTVSVTTRKNNNTVEIKVRDNGNGIPQKTLDKIFQPFFTTKPTGQGTGLGLSMSYDIITKGHGGELRVETKEGEYSTFTIVLPR